MEQTATARIASNLRAELGRRKLTGRGLASLCGWPVSNASRRINGDQAMPMDELQLISRSADIPLTVLLDGVEGAEPPVRAAADAGHAGLSLLLPGGLLVGLILLAGLSGKLGYCACHLPAPSPQGFGVLAVAVLIAGCWLRLQRVETSPHEWAGPDPAKPEKWPAGRDGVDGPWFGTPVPELDPDAALPTLLPDPDNRVRS